MSATILNVNDREPNRYFISRVLKAAGFEVLEAENGEQALALAQRMPDLVVLDVHLPDLSGLDVARRLRADPSTQNLLILHVSGISVFAANRIEGLENGADAYLTEPVEPGELLATIRALLRLKRAEEEARAAVRMRDEFFSIASHELRNPLSALVLQLQRMQRDMRRNVPVDPAPRGSRIDAAERNATRLAELVQDLLDTTRIRAGRLELERSRFDLNGLVDDVVRRLEPEATAAGTRLHVRSSGPIEGLWDASRLEQVVANLLSNAIKYGGGSQVEIALAQDERDAFVSVRDGGPGVAAEQIPRLFEPFERGEQTAGKSGLGLGLYIAQKIAESHGGRIEVRSELGAGSTFTLALPLGPSDADA